MKIDCIAQMSSPIADAPWTVAHDQDVAAVLRKAFQIAIGYARHLHGNFQLDRPSDDFRIEVDVVVDWRSKDFDRSPARRDEGIVDSD